MKQLKQNAFWVGVVVAAAVLVAGYALMVLPLNMQKGKKQTEIRGILKTLGATQIPGDPDTASWKAYKADLMKDYSTITKFYEGCDAHLERWFPGLPAEPDHGTFTGKYRDEAKEIEKKLVEKYSNKPGETPIKIGIESDAREGEAKKTKGGFNWEDPTPDDWDKIGVDKARVLKTLQKRFWARQRVANVVLEGGVKVSRVVDFRFLRRLHDKLMTAEWENPIMGSPVQPFPPTMMEFDLPEELGRTLTFRFAVELPFSEVPKFLQELLNPSAQASAQERLLLSIPQAHVTIFSQNEPEKKYTIPKGDAEARKKVEDEVRQLNAARDVQLVVTCQIIDFEPSKVRKFDGAEAPANP
jgi:hypothetical protein